MIPSPQRLWRASITSFSRSTSWPARSASSITPPSELHLLRDEAFAAGDAADEADEEPGLGVRG